MISIVGSGRVGSSIAFLCVSHGLDDVLLFNPNKEKAIGESLDVASAIPADSKFSIHGTDDYSELSSSDIVVITASVGVYEKDRTENMGLQVRMIKEIAQKIKQYCPSAIILIVSNPLDVLTYFFQKESNFSRFKVIGIASSLDTSRFRYYISETLSVPQSSISNALVLGEHGDSMVPVFSGVKVGGNPLFSMIDTRDPITDAVRNYWKTLRNFKSRSQFGIAKNVFDVIESILHKREIFIPASVVLEGEYGENDVSMGVPVKIGRNGVSEIQKIKLDDTESSSLKKSAEKIRNDIKSLQD
ncbi:MAG: lactate dehydrogenase [Nitrosopumilus sp.]|uniref:malate dehydrogenase n=1 Tax=Nitrosopumilus sp. TaxID=2024843 RepID=UPI00246AFCEE|nr:lactate dehydrogenase [Nitrosopumilus sp.]MDH5431561.1 lactate dehydrogenase [Nitrosopumilus sp.]MDH5697667.1 lactate dehydrogenase [Nitrosopumilus sp.]